jgi:Protein of unknown function (DUF998)
MVTSRLGPTLARLLALVAAGGVVLAVALTVVGHIDHDPGLNPVSRTISDYALSDRGGPVEIAMFSLGLGSLALLAGMRGLRTPVRGLASGLRAPVRGLASGLLAVWGVGLLCSAVVPTDPVGTPALSPSGQFHRYASVAAFVALPAAAVLLAGRLATDRRWRGLSAYLRWLAAVCGVGLVALVYVAFPGDRVMIGLVERLLVASEVALVGVLAVGLARSVRWPPRLAGGV